MKNEKKKPRERRKKARKVDFDQLLPAIVDGKFIAKKGDEIALRRPRSADQVLVTVCTVMKVEDDGWVNLWDETLGQCFGFNVNTDVTIHGALKLLDGNVIPTEKVKDGVTMDEPSGVGAQVGFIDEGTETD